MDMILIRMMGEEGGYGEDVQSVVVGMPFELINM